MQCISAACDVQSERPSVRRESILTKALRWKCLANNTNRGFGCITLELNDIPNAKTDWENAREIWAEVDASSYDTQPTPFMFFFRSNCNWELCCDAPVGYLYDLNTKEWSRAATDGFYSLLLPPGFCGWIRMPLSRKTFATPYWEKFLPFEEMSLEHVNTLSFGLAQRDSSTGAAADFLRFVLCTRPWQESVGLPGDTPDWQEVLPLGKIGAGVRLAEDNDVQQFGRDYNDMAGISFSVQVVEPPTEYLLLMAHAPLLLHSSHREFVLPGEHILLCTAENTHYLQSQGPSLEYDLIRMRLTQEDLKKLSAWGISLGEAVALKEPRAVREWIQGMACGYQNRPVAWQESLNACLQALLFLVSQTMVRVQTFGRYNMPLCLLRYQIYEDPVSVPSIEQVAQELHLSVSGVQHAYKRLFGCSYTSDLIESRIQRAKLLLKETDHPVAAVGELCGYETLPHFMRQFKQNVGMTPGNYRRNGTDRKR